MKTQIAFLVVFCAVASLQATRISFGEPDAAAPAKPAAVPAAPVQAQIRIVGGGGGGGGFGGVLPAVPAPAQVRVGANNGVVRFFNYTAPNGQGTQTLNGGQDQNPKAAEIAEVMRELRASENVAEKADLKMRLGNAVTDYFDEDVKARETELTNLEERVKKLRAQLDRRKAAKEEIIQLQLKVLMNDADGLGFTTESESRSEPDTASAPAIYSAPIIQPVPPMPAIIPAKN